MPYKLAVVYYLIRISIHEVILARIIRDFDKLL